jgi:hypothetical protein
MVWAVSLSTTKLSPRRLTHDARAAGIRSLVGVGNQHLAPSPSSALPPAVFLRLAAPQCISGRTSYLHVRLAFHPYPQVIPQFCNTGECAPRRLFTAASRCPWIAHVVSGPIIATGPPPARGTRPLQTRFPSGCPALALVNHCDDDALAGSFYKRHAISPCLRCARVTSDCL